METCAGAIGANVATTLGCVGLGVVNLALGLACIAGASVKAGSDASRVCGGGANGRRKKRSFGGMQILGVFDTNGDGYLSYEDIPPVVTDRNVKLMMTSIMMMMPLLDTDNDGRLSQPELMTFREATQTDQGQLQYMFKYVDTNRDNRLTPNEMIQVSGACSILDKKTDAFDGFKRMMQSLGSDGKGFVDFQDVWNWYISQPQLTGQDTLWNFQSLRRQQPHAFDGLPSNLQVPPFLHV